jgi:hypothetical protein
MGGGSGGMGSGSSMMMISSMSVKIQSKVGKLGEMNCTVVRGCSFGLLAHRQEVTAVGESLQH